MPLHTNTTIRIEGHRGLADTFASLQIHEHIDDHHTFSLALPGEAFGAGDGTGRWRGLVGQRITIEMAPLDDFYGIRPDYDPKFFSGIITGLQLGKGHGPNGHVVLTGGASTLLLDGDPHTQSFTGHSLKRIVEGELSYYPANLLRPKVDPRNTDRLDYVVQYNENTWQLLRRLARTHGEWLYYNGENMVFGSRNPDTISLTHEVDLDDFDLQMQLGQANRSMSGYDYRADEQVEEPAPSRSGLNPYSQRLLDAAPGLFRRAGRSQPNRRLGGAAARRIRQLAHREQATSVAQMVTMSGASHHVGLAVGNEISVEESVNVREAYGTWMLTEVRHHCSSEGGYQNHFCGVPADVATPPHRIDDHPRAETQSAVVVGNNDPEDLGRVQVQFRWQDGGRTPWLRTLSPAAGVGKGLYMIPEKGEEVMVDFAGGNPERPYVLGAAWNGGVPAGFGTEKNDIKAIKTRSGHTIELNDKKGGESITIKDKNGNSIHMDTKNKSIIINAPEDMMLNAKNMSINVEENLDVSVGKNKTEQITEDWLISANNEDKKINKEAKIISASYRQEAQEIQAEASGEIINKAGSKITLASADGVDYAE